MRQRQRDQTAIESNLGRPGHERAMSAQPGYDQPNYEQDYNDKNYSDNDLGQQNGYNGRSPSFTKRGRC